MGKDVTVNLKDEVGKNENRQTKGKVLEVGSDFLKVRFTEGRDGSSLDPNSPRFMVSYVPIGNIRTIHSMETRSE